MARPVVKFSLPQTKQDALPHVGAFGLDDFYRARYYSAVIGRYCTTAETDKLLAYAREARLPGLSFVQLTESMARFIHGAQDMRKAIDTLLMNAQKPREQVEREMAFIAVVKQAMHQHDHPQAVQLAITEGLATIYPKATRERIVGALQAGNTPQGFNASIVIETMQLTEPKEA